MTLKIGSLFSGVGGLDLAVEQFFDAETAWHCEWDDEPSKVLAARWPGVPNYRDVRTVDWENIEPVDIMCGGFPCQDVSLAGRRAGMKEGTRSGLWSEFARAIDIVRPKVVVIENVRGLLSADAGSNVEPCPWCMGDGADEYHLRALDAVVADLSDLGFDAEWTGLRAADVGAPHGRFRFFLVAYARGEAREFWAGLRTGEPGEFGWGRSDDGARETGTPVERPLLRTPVADELGGGPLHPDVAKERGQTLRLSGQILALTGHLLPTPVAQPSGNTPEEHLRKKPGRQVVTDLAILVENGLLETGGRLLPTPTASEGAKGGPNQVHGGGDRTLSGEANSIRIAWGEYEPAVRLWESLTRPAPPPTLLDGKNGNHRLAAVFPEWMMGYPAGWVTDILRRNPAIKACGNGVVPQQAFAALTILWGRVLHFLEVPS